MGIMISLLERILESIDHARMELEDVDTNALREFAKDPEAENIGAEFDRIADEIDDILQMLEDIEGDLDTVIDDLKAIRGEG